VVLQDADTTSWTCEPPLPARDRLSTATYAAWRANGLDHHVGRRLATLLRRAGLVDVELEPDVRSSGTVVRCSGSCSRSPGSSATAR
jgi:hypothetical protein